MVDWSYRIFVTSDFDGFNAKLKSGVDAIVGEGLTPSVSYSHAATPNGYSYSAIILGVPPPGPPAAAEAGDQAPPA